MNFSKINCVMQYVWKEKKKSVMKMLMWGHTQTTRHPMSVLKLMIWRNKWLWDISMYAIVCRSLGTCAKNLCNLWSKSWFLFVPYMLKTQRFIIYLTMLTFFSKHSLMHQSRPFYYQNNFYDIFITFFVVWYLF